MVAGQAQGESQFNTSLQTVMLRFCCEGNTMTGDAMLMVCQLPKRTHLFYLCLFIVFILILKTDYKLLT